jgi:hypothetical protein
MTDVSPRTTTDFTDATVVIARDRVPYLSAIGNHPRPAANRQYQTFRTWCAR